MAMLKKSIALAFALSAALHIALPLAETVAERYGTNTETFDRVVSWPASVFGVMMPPGHGIPQLVLPFLFSVGTYAGIFWLLLLLYGLLRKKRMPM